MYADRFERLYLTSPPVVDLEALYHPDGAFVSAIFTNSLFAYSLKYEDLNILDCVNFVECC